MAEIRIKQKLREGKAVGVLSGPHNVDMVEWLGHTGVDGVWLECEHGPVSWEQIGDFSRACDLTGMASIVRVNANEPWLITRTLDRGASGIVVPHVSTKADAQKVATAATFAPLGERGMFSGRRSYGASDYYNQANADTLVVVLIEEKRAVDNLAEILTVPNIDVFFVAPSDLAQTMGHIGDHQHPTVQATIERAIKQIVDAGRTAGTLVVDEDRDRFMEMGVRFVYTSWQQWVAQSAKTFRAALDAHGR